MKTAPPKRPRMKLSPPMQRALYHASASTSTQWLADYITEHGDRLAQLGARRAFDEAGLEEYGDISWHLPLPLKYGELDAELADALFYVAAVMQHAVVARIVKERTE